MERDGALPEPLAEYAPFADLVCKVGADLVSSRTANSRKAAPVYPGVSSAGREPPRTTTQRRKRSNDNSTTKPPSRGPPVEAMPRVSHRPGSIMAGSIMDCATAGL
jgi:hypothetical protein